jgi:cold-inducible RNA-binding protein
VLMGHKIFIKNIPFSTKKQEIRELFENAGHVVEIHILRDKETGKSRGMAIVEMSNDFEAHRAIDRYDDFRFNGRLIKVLPSESES